MARREAKPESTHRKRGTRFGFRFFEGMLRVFGLRAAYAWLKVVCLYYLCFDRDAVARALPFVRHRFPGSSWLRQRIHIYRQFINLGEQLIDRHAIVSGYNGFSFDLKGFEKLSTLIEDSKRGIILLTSHIGNWQIAMTRLELLDRPVHLLMRQEDNPAVHESLKIRQGGDKIAFISPDGYLGGVVEIMNVLKQGDMVAIMADRTYGAAGVSVSFLGAKAVFPYGAFKIAAASQTPIVLLLSAKTDTNRYLVDVSHVFDFAEHRRQKRQEIIDQAVQTYANILETYAESYPYQCFFFHDLWASDVE